MEKQQLTVWKPGLSTHYGLCVLNQVTRQRSAEYVTHRLTVESYEPHMKTLYKLHNVIKM